MPTAVVAWTLKINTSKGVISEPPPTPVNPTRRPTTKPESAKEGLIAWRMSIVSVPLRPKFVGIGFPAESESIDRADIQARIRQFAPKRLRTRERPFLILAHDPAVPAARTAASLRSTRSVAKAVLPNRMDPNGLSALEVHSNAKREGFTSADVTP